MKLFGLHHIKRAFLTSLLLLLLGVSALEAFLPAFHNSVLADPDTTVAVDPSTSSVNPGGYFTFNVSIADVTDLFGWGFKLGWPVGLLEANAANITEGPFLKQGGTTGFAKKAFSNYIDVGCSFMGVNPGVSGSGVIATVTLKVLDTGDATLDLYSTTLLDPTLTEIAHVSQDGYFYTTWPKPDFSYSPNPLDNPGHPIQGEMITFDASSSFDPDGGAIVLYEWDFGDETFDEGQIVTHTFDTAVSYSVTLTVTDDEGETYDGSKSILVLLHDISVIEVVADPTGEVVAGNAVTINATVLNNGTASATFNVTVYYDDTPIDTKTYRNLSPTENDTLSFTWNTQVAAGEYTIKAYAYLVDSTTLESRPDLETNMEDNTGIDGTVTVMVPAENHDIAILSVVPSPTTVMVGDSVNIDVEVTNQGDFDETFTVEVYANADLINQTEVSLASGETTTVSFIWTTNAAGEFIISAEVPPVEGEVYVADNQLEDGTVVVQEIALAIESCDYKGAKKDIFELNETVYVTGSGFSTNTTYKLYIVKDVATWTNGTDISTLTIAQQTSVLSDEYGNILSSVWSEPLTPGKYDIVVDFNDNGVYDEGVDALDDNDLQVETAGFLVIPEYAFGTILGLLSFFAAFGVFLRSRRLK